MVAELSYDNRTYKTGSSCTSALMNNPFAGSQAQAGYGRIHLAIVPPDVPSLRTVSYQYPLKLVSPKPISTSDKACDLVHTVYLLTYGGGIVAGDTVNLTIVLEPKTSLSLLTQGSTKLFKSPDKDLVSKQDMIIDLHPEAVLCYLPDPVQPFAGSSFEQRQVYNIRATPGAAFDSGGICVLDWVSQGRSANGENWSLSHYSSSNEIYLRTKDEPKTLLLRDSMKLEHCNNKDPLAKRMHGAAITATLIIRGKPFVRLMRFFMEEFKAHPRVGGRQWDVEATENKSDSMHDWRTARHYKEIQEGLLWSAAAVRGTVVVKFSSRSLEYARIWLRDMLEFEGTVVEKFGQRALLCLR